ERNRADLFGAFDRRMDRCKSQRPLRCARGRDRGLKGPRIYESSGIPLHYDNRTVVKERIHLDKTDPNVLRDELAVFDHALTRPWEVTRSYRRLPDPTWIEDVCAENNNYVFVGRDTYFLSPDGYLMPTRKDQ